MNIKKTVLTAFLFLLAVGAPFSFSFGELESPEETWTSWDDIMNFVNFVEQAVYTIFIVAIVICLVLAAFYFITAGGSQDKVDKAKMWVRNAVIGAAIALLAAGMMALVKNLMYEEPSGSDIGQEIAMEIEEDFEV